MTDLPNDVEEALRTIEEFRASAPPTEQNELERTRARVSSEVQQNAQQEQRARLAEQVGDKHPALAQALRNDENVDANFPAVSQALNALAQIENLEAQKNNLEEQIAELRANTEATLAGANAVLEVRAKQANKSATTARKQDRAATEKNQVGE